MTVMRERNLGRAIQAVTCSLLLAVSTGILLRWFVELATGYVFIEIALKAIVVVLAWYISLIGLVRAVSNAKGYVNVLFSSLGFSFIIAWVEGVYAVTKVFNIIFTYFNV